MLEHAGPTAPHELGATPQVAEVMASDDLYAEWVAELKVMSGRIIQVSPFAPHLSVPSRPALNLPGSGADACGTARSDRGHRCGRRLLVYHKADRHVRVHGGLHISHIHELFIL
eukprot:SAG11_NODE_61_length_19011_cov_49.624048_3_plen_114_part_00